jgi:IstB-like ATP binding protein
VRQLRCTAPAGARVVIATPPGEEAQVDYGDGPMVRHPDTGKYRRTRLFALTGAFAQSGALHLLLEALAEATLDGTRKDVIAELATVPLLIIDDLGMRKLPHTAAEDLLEIVMRRYERASTILTSIRPVDDWRKLLGETATVTALLDRLLHHAHVLKCGPRSWRTKVHLDLRPEEALK